MFPLQILRRIQGLNLKLIEKSKSNSFYYFNSNFPQNKKTERQNFRQSNWVLT